MEKIKTLFNRLLSRNGWCWLLLYLVVRPLKNTTILSDKFIVRVMYHCELGRALNLKSPKTFNEKLQWLKINVRDPLLITIVDKIKVKDYVSAIIGEQYIIPTFQTAEKFEDIDFSTLPDSFVIKANHDSGSVFVCNDRNKLSVDMERLKVFFNTSLKRNYYYEGREWAYKEVKPRLLVEKYLENINGEPLRDYKFFCFDGEPKFLYVSEELYKHDKVKMQYFSDDFGPTDIHFDEYLPFSPKKPARFDEMKQIARDLSRNFKFARIDLYYINGNIYFSEITLYPAGGFRKYPNDVDLKIGEMLKLEV